ncbi:MAG: hypothetical protein CMH83_11400 [Nocardioides sp.]|nr:hypothetical protein [Nocardioides sp.]
MSSTDSVARATYRHLEPVHAVTYFAPQAHQAYVDAGLTGFWRGYFAGRAACLGAGAPEPVVTALFNTFAPSTVARSIPSVWERISPEAALAARLDGARAALAALEPDPEAVRVAADVAVRAATSATLHGRALGAAEAAQPYPGGDDDLGRLWRAATVLREVRGDGHVAALLAHGLSGLEATVLRCGDDLARSTLQPMRGWSDEEWESAEVALRGRDLLDDDARATRAGTDLLAVVEQVTDDLAAQPWDAVGAEATAAFLDATADLVAAARAAYLAPAAGLGLAGR